MGNSVPDVGFVGEGIEPADAALVGTEAEQALALRMPGQAHHLCIRILGTYILSFLQLLGNRTQHKYIILSKTK